MAEFGWVPAEAGAKLPDGATRWTASAGTILTPTTPVTLSWDNGQGLRFSRIYSVDDHYMFTVEQTVANTGAAPVTLYPYGLITRTGTPQTAGYYILHEGLLGWLDNSLKEIKYSSLKEGEPVEQASTGGWLGITDKYWLTALVPDQKDQLKGRFTHSVADHLDRYQADYLGAAVTVPPGGSAGASGRFFAGAKEVKLLDVYVAQGIPRFDLAVDWGWFWFLTKPIFYALDFLY